MKKVSLNYQFSKALYGGSGDYLLKSGGLSRSGFSLIEIIVVVVVMALAAMIAVPMMSSAGSFQIQSAANMITADIEYAKNLAIGKGQAFSVVFDTDTDRYWIEDQDGSIIEHPVKKGFNYLRDFRNDGRLNKVDLYKVSFDLTSEIRFDYLGSPYNGSGSALTDGTISLLADGSSVVINVEPVTGYTSITN